MNTLAAPSPKGNQSAEYRDADYKEYEDLFETGCQLIENYFDKKHIDEQTYLLQKESSNFWNWWTRQFENEYNVFVTEYMPIYEDDVDEYGICFANIRKEKAYKDHVKQLPHSVSVHHRLYHFIVEQKIIKK